MKQKNATNRWMSNYYLFTCEEFVIELSVMWIFSSCAPSVSLPDVFLLKMRYEYTSPPDMLKKREKQVYNKTYILGNAIAYIGNVSVMSNVQVQLTITFN